MTQDPTNKSKDTLKRYEEIWNKMRDLITSITKNSDYYDEKYMKIKFNSDDDLHLKKKIKLCNMTLVFWVVLYEDSKYNT